jgi:hypothetical protein
VSFAGIVSSNEGLVTAHLPAKGELVNHNNS